MSIKKKLMEKGINIDDMTEREKVLLDILDELISSKTEQQPELKTQQKEEQPQQQYTGQEYSYYNQPYAPPTTYYNPYAPPPPAYTPPTQGQEPVTNILDKYAEDPYIGDFVKALRKELETVKNVAQLIGTDYLNFKKQAIQMANDLEFRRIHRERYSKDKEQYKFLPDLSKDELIKVAQQKGINTWDGAYDAWLADKIRGNWVNYRKEMEEALRKEIVHSTPPPTEITSRPAPEETGTAQKQLDYDKVWIKLAKELEKYPV